MILVLARHGHTAPEPALRRALGFRTPDVGTIWGEVVDALRARDGR